MKYGEMIQKMTLEEKAAFLSGKGEWQTWDFERLGIPSMYCSDGPHGIRKQAGAGDHLGLNPSLPATCFPTAATMAMVRLAPSMVTTCLRYSSTICFTASKWLPDSPSAAFPQFSGSARAGCATHKLLPLPATCPFSHSIEICREK